MKKKYTKPTVLIESFELSQHIAACSNPVKNKNNAVKDGCKVDVPSLGISGLFYTNLANDVCTVDGESIYCYTPGNGNNYVFSS